MLQGKHQDLIAQGLESRQKRLKNARYLKQVKPDKKLFEDFDFHNKIDERELT